jgi:hypothetical protein
MHLVGTLVVLVSIRIATVIVGIAAIKSIEPESASKALVAKMPTMEPTGELMKFSAAEAAAAKTTTEGACMETATETAAMESTATMATATAPSQRFVVGHQDRSEQGADDSHWKLVSHLTFSVALMIGSRLRDPNRRIVIPVTHGIVTTILF